MNIHIPADFTLNELQAFIDGQQTAEPPEGYYTAEEWADHFEIYITKMRGILKRAKAGGLLDMMHVSGRRWMESRIEFRSTPCGARSRFRIAKSL